MTDAEIRRLLLDYTQDAADAKDDVGASILEQIAREPRPAAPKPRPSRARRLIAAAAILVLALTVFFQTPAGEAVAAYVYETVVQRFFSPKPVNQKIEGMDELEILYPHGEIVESEGAGIASYVIYIDETYTVTARDNLLRVTYDNPPRSMTEAEEAELRAIYADELGLSQEEIDDLIAEQKAAYAAPPVELPPVFMEITQVPGCTVEEMVEQVLAEGGFVPAEDVSTAEFPYAALSYSAGQESHSRQVSVHIRDNLQGGVFLITTQYFFEAAEGHGMRLAMALHTLEILDTADYE